MSFDRYGDAAEAERRNPAPGFGILFIGLVFVACALCWAMAALDDVERPELRSTGRTGRRAD